MKLIKHTILDERELQLIRQAGHEAFLFMILGSMIIYLMEVYVNQSHMPANDLLLLILGGLVFFFYRASKQGVQYYNSVRLTVWGCLATTLLVTILIMVKNYQVNHLIYGNNPLHGMYLLTWVFTYILYLPWVFLGNYVLSLLGNYQKVRFERQLDQEETE